jgi:nitroreductase
MEFFDVVRTRRSVRAFTDQPVDRADLEAIVQAGLDAPTGVNAQLKQYIVIDDPAVMDTLRPISRALATAPAAIVQLIDPQPTKFGEYWRQDASASMENMLLAAVALGYASVWVEGAVRRAEREIAEALGVPEPLQVSALMPVGRPDETPERPPKPTLDEVIHYNSFGGE